MTSLAKTDQNSPLSSVYDKLGEDGSKLTVVINLSEKTIPTKKVAKYICPKATEILSNYNDAMGATLRPYEARVFFTK